MAKWKMIGIRVPEESDLPARLKEMSEKTRLSYCELLEKLLTQAELSPNMPEFGFEVKDITALHTLAEKYSDLRLQVHEIGARLRVLEKIAGPEKKPNPLQAREAPAATSLERAQEIDRLNLDETEGSELVELIAEAVGPKHPEKSAIEPDVTELSTTIEGKSEESAATIAYIRHLSAEGLSLRKIAERLKAEGRPTLSGSGVWHYGMVQKILAAATRRTE